MRVLVLAMCRTGTLCEYFCQYNGPSSGTDAETRLLDWSSWPILAQLDHTIARSWYSLMRLQMACFCNNWFDGTARQRYPEHCEHVRDVVPEASSLDFRDEDGWRPLCESLEQPAPDSEYPNINDSKRFMAFGRKLRNMSAMIAARNILGCASLFHHDVVAQPLPLHANFRHPRK